MGPGGYKKGGAMKRFLCELSFVLKTKRHFFFLVVVWTVLAVVAYAYGISLDKTVSEAFSDKDNKEVRELSFEIEETDKAIITADDLKNEVKLNEVLVNDSNFSYSLFVETTCTITNLKNMELQADALENVETDDSEGQKSYEVKLLMLTKENFKDSGLENLDYFFGFANDYSASVPAMFGSQWMNEGIQMGTPSEEIITEFGNYTLCGYGYFQTGTTIKSAGKEIVLDKYIVLPLNDLVEGGYPETQDGRNNWYKIYRLRNQGTITTDMTSNELQKYFDELMETEELPYRLLVEGADYNNKILFDDEMSQLSVSVIKIARIAIILAGVLIVAYILGSYSIGARYIFLTCLTGTSKLEYIFVNLIHNLIYAFLSVAPAAVLLVGLCKITSATMPSLSCLLVPVGVLVAVGILSGTVRIILWDAGKKLRSI